MMLLKLLQRIYTLMAYTSNEMYFLIKDMYKDSNTFEMYNFYKYVAYLRDHILDGYICSFIYIRYINVESGPSFSKYAVS